MNSYNYEGIDFIVDYLEMCGYKQSRCDRYHQLISILYNYKRNVPPSNAEILYGIKPEMVKTVSYRNYTFCIIILQNKKITKFVNIPEDNIFEY